MLACVVDCSQICQARASNRCSRTGCEANNLWPSERDLNHDQNVLFQTFPRTVGYSEGSIRTEDQQCLDEAYHRLGCIPAAKGRRVLEVDRDGVEQEDRIRREGDQNDNEGNCDQVTESLTSDKRRPDEEEKSTRQGLPVRGGPGTNCEVTKSSFPRQLQRTNSTSQCSTIGSLGTSVDPNLRGFIGSTQVELGPSASGLRFRDASEFESADNIRQGKRNGKEPQLAERGSSSHDFFGEPGLDIAGSSRRDERGLSSSWGDELPEVKEEQNLTFRGEHPVECGTSNVDHEEDHDFANLHVQEFATSHRQDEEPAIAEGTRRTERGEFQTRRGEHSQESYDSQRAPSALHQSPKAQTDITLRARAGSSHLRRPSEEEPEGSQPRLDVDPEGHRTPGGAEAVSLGRVGKTHERDEKLHPSVELRPHRKSSPASEERRVRPRLVNDASPGAIGGKGEHDAEEAVKTVRPSRPSGGKDRHSKVNTAKGPRDRRVRLSVPTAVQFYDVQDRLGYDQPSKAVEWLIKNCKAAIDELGRLPVLGANEGTPTVADITHASSFPVSLLDRPVTGASSSPQPGSFTAALTNPFGGHHVGNHLSYFMDSSIQKGMSFGNNPVHVRDVGVLGLTQAHLAGLGFPLGQTDLSRGFCGSTEGGKVAAEFAGSPLARVESRVKARERARERVKEKGCGSTDVGRVGDASSPSSMQSPPLHQSPIHSSFTMIQNVMQSSIHSLAQQSPHQTPLQSSLSSVYNTALSGILQSSQQGTLQNLIMQNPSVQSPLTDQVHNALQHPFQVSLEDALHSSQSMTSLNSGMQQQPHLQMSSLPGNAQGGLHRGSGYTSGPSTSPFSDPASSLASSHYMPSISSLSGISQPLSIPQLSALGIPISVTTQFPSTNSAVPTSSGFSPGPPASAFRPRPMSMGQASPKDQQQLLNQGLSRPQLILPSYSVASPSPTASSSPKASPPLYYSPTSSRMGTHQPHKSPAPFSSIRSYDYQRMVSPGRPSSSGSQIPARIQGLEDVDEEMESTSPSSPHVHP